MKQSTFYHQLGVYLLAQDTNIHPGACVCAAASIYEMPETHEASRHKIDERLREWFGEHIHNCTREAFAPASQCNIETIVSAIGDTIDELHIVGHDIIQGSAALKSLHRLEGRVPQSIVDEIAMHIKANGKAHPGLFHGYSSEDIRKEEASFDNYNADSTPSDVVDSLVHTLRLIKKSYFGFHFLAQETHLFTHAEAMISIHKLGYHDLFKRSLKGWFLRLKLLEIIYDLNLDDTHKSPRIMDWDPRSISFWDAYDSYELNIHPIKTMFSYLNLKRCGLISYEDIQFLEKEKLPYLADSRFPDDW